MLKHSLFCHLFMKDDLIARSVNFSGILYVLRCARGQLLLKMHLLIQCGDTASKDTAICC